MLKRIRLKDFKSFVDEEVEVAPLTLLVGANASGKSNFLDAIRFLQGLFFDLSLDEVLNGEQRVGPDGWLGIRGRAEESARLGQSKFAVESKWLAPHKSIEYLSKQVEVHHRILCRTSPFPGLEEEWLTADIGDPWLLRPKNL